MKALKAFLVALSLMILGGAAAQAQDAAPPLTPENTLIMQLKTGRVVI